MTVESRRALRRMDRSVPCSRDLDFADQAMDAGISHNTVSSRASRRRNSGVGDDIA